MKRIIVIFLVLFCFVGVNATARGTSARQKTVLLKTIGVLSAQSVYLTYTSIGSCADGHAKGNYKDDFAARLLKEYNVFNKASIKQLNSLLSSGVLGSQDVQFVSKLIETFELLQAQANGYRNYILTRKLAHKRIYSRKRKQAWRNISELLGLNK